MIVLSGRRSAVSTCAFTKDGKFIAGAMLDGSIQLWKSAGPYVSHRNINFKGTCGIVLFFTTLLPFFPDEVIDAALWSASAGQ